MTHLSEGDLRAHLDHELPASRADQCAAHLLTCPVCQQRLAAMQARVEHIRATLQHLPPSSQAWRLNPRAAYRRFQSFTHTKELSMSSKLPAWLRPALTGALMLAVLVAAFTLAPARQALSAFLSLFRVEQVTVITFDPNALPANFANRVDQANLQTLFNDSVDVQGGGELLAVADAAAATTAAGYPVRLLAQPATELLVQPGLTAKGTLQAAQLQAILDALEMKDVTLPKDLDGATLTLQTGAAVVASYGNCVRYADLSAATMRGPRTGGPMRGAPRDPSCVALWQMPSPQISADPATVDPRPLGEVLLRVLGRTPAEARQLSQSINWATTLVIPIPTGAADYREVTVNGATATLIVEAEAETPAYTLVWTSNGMVYALFGFGDAAQGVALAQSLK